MIQQHRCLPCKSLPAGQKGKRKMEGEKERGGETEKKDTLARHEGPRPDQTDRLRQIVPVAQTKAGGS